MAVLAVFMLLVMLSGSVLSSGDLLVACSTDDIDCLSKSTEKFLEQTHKGIPAWNILAIDPLVIPSFDIVFDSDGITYKNKNLTVTGLRNQKISDFKMDTAAKSVVLTTKADLNMAADVSKVFTATSKIVSGHCSSHASVLGTATYTYELKTDDKGVEHFHVGPEITTCKVVNTPTAECDPELQQSIATDLKENERREKMFCKVVEKAYEYVVHNIRAAAKAVPATAFFNNIH